jgi:uncharacterized protein (TIGR03000 family)
MHAGSMHAGSMHPGNGNFHNNNFHNNNFHNGFRGAVFVGGFWPGFYGPWGGYSPSYYSYYDFGGVAMPSTAYAAPYSDLSFANPVAPAPQMPPPDATAPPPPDQTAEIHVLLPQGDAKVWVDGTPMTTGSGTKRAFVSPPLEAGYAYSYRITAVWMENGKEVRAERTVRVAPGRYSFADFTKAGNAPPAPQPPPPAQEQEMNEE